MTGKLESFKVLTALAITGKSLAPYVASLKHPEEALGNCERLAADTNRDTQDYNNFHRIDLHKELLRCIEDKTGDGPPVVLKVNHRATNLDYENGLVEFDNGTTAKADLIIAADGIRVRSGMFLIYAGG